MKILKVLIVVILLSALGMVFWSGKKDKDAENSLVERKFNEKSILKITETNQNLSDKVNFFVPNPETIMYNIIVDDQERKLAVINRDDLKTDEEFRLKIPQYCSLLHFFGDEIFFKDRLEVYAMKVSDGSMEKLFTNDLQVFNLFAINRDHFLCLANYRNANKMTHQFGFLLFNRKNNEISILDILHESEENVSIQNSLKYSGKFQRSGDVITYTPDKVGTVYLYDLASSEKELLEINTIDNILPPEITEVNGMYTYKRGFTFYSNSASFVRDGKLYTFSCKPNDVSYMILDEYDIKQKAYNGSYKVEFNGMNSNNINLIYLDNTNNQLIIAFDNLLLGSEILL